ncbi:MAG: 1-(5-phosphoribosyl)-5-[(5-phosphoribosylamino)methylideneamino]imidazole-4-carboxamide isomerase [Nitrospinota bacterium]|nr:1-(5-phosphoribosyl)-5-[(5-phosphoribosylamino)methylideneamino]imidazole-4-carboxamide isomerase [Nitrospinota bacterium]|tara:strand:- start:2665 stop:3393 length:729 start_codon:yes stop_codon:yes gene_type:complete
MFTIPAVDIKDGKCVRLIQGKMDKEIIYSDDPAEMAKKWEDLGAGLLHVVDLNGAIEGNTVNKKSIESILKNISIPIEVGGGIRDMETVETFINMGVQKIILGTAAKENPDFVKTACKNFPGRIVVGIDAKDGFVAVRGWVEKTEQKATEMAKKLEEFGVSAIIFTDVMRDGMLEGPNVERTRELAEFINIPVIASGGISELRDIENTLALKKYGVVGVIVGRALYDKKIDFKDVLALEENR